MELVESKILTLGVSDVPNKIHKKKRIQKKWIKKYGYAPIPDPNLYIFDGKIIGHPIIIKRLIKGINEKNSNISI